MAQKKPYFLLAGLVSIAYANVYLNSFHFDDLTAILQKPWIRGLDKIPMFLFSFFQRPLVILSFNLNYYFSEFQVWSYHLFNIIFHTIAVWLIYRLVLELRAFSRNSDLLLNRKNGFLSATLFALHPLNTQSVTYISSRSSIMATCLYLAATIFFLKGFSSEEDTLRKISKINSKKEIWITPFILSISFLFFGILCKEIIITFPAIAFLAHFLFISRYSVSDWIRQNFRVIFLVAFCLILIIALIFPSKIRTLLRMTPDAFTWKTYLLTQTFVIPFEYFWKFFFPFNLSIDIDFPIISDWTRFSSFFGLFILGFYLWVCSKVSSRIICFGMIWGLVTFIPTSSFFPLFDIAVEHRTYLPLAGFSLAMGAIISNFSKVAVDWLRKKTSGNISYNFFTLIPPLIIIICFGTLTAKRNEIWKDEISLWSDAKFKAPKIVRPYNNIGKTHDKLGNYSHAISEFKGALSLNPNYVFALSNLGNIYGKLKDYEKSANYLRKAISIKPNYAPANYNLGKVLHVTGKTKQAREYYQKAVTADPYFVEAIFNLAFLEKKLGFYEDSVKNYRKFIDLRPKVGKAYLGLGRALLGAKENTKAIKAFLKAIELNPASLSANVSLANTYFELGDIDNSISIFNRILKRFPKTAGVHKNLGLIYYKNKQNPQKAIYHFKKSIELDSKQPHADQIRSIIVELEPKLPNPSQPHLLQRNYLNKPTKH